MDGWIDGWMDGLSPDSPSAGLMYDATRGGWERQFWISSGELRARGGGGGIPQTCEKLFI